MRIVTYVGAVSLDGFLADVDGAIDWLHFSKDVQEAMANYWKNVDTVLMGRKTYALTVPAPGEKRKGPHMPKVKTYVFSRALKEIENSEVELVREGASEFVRRLKGLPGRELCLLGGGELAQSLMAAGLVDRVRLNIHPVLLGAGTPAFRDTGARVKLRLTEGRAIEGGCVLANYEVLR